MAQRVERAGNNLLHGNGQRVAGVKERELRLRAPKSALDFLFLVGDDGPVVHLAAGAEHRDDGAEGDKLRWECVLGVLQFPNVLVQFGLRGDDLAAVGNAAAAHGEDKVHMILPRQLCALLRLGIGGVGHDAVELHDALAGGVQNAHDLIIHAIALDGAAAIRQHDGVAVVIQQAAQILLHAALAEIHLGLVLKNKVVHGSLPPVNFQNLPPILLLAVLNRIRCCHEWKAPRRPIPLHPVPTPQCGLSCSLHWNCRCGRKTE